MATIYRGIAKDNYYKNDGRIAPSIRLSASRDSKALAAKAVFDFLALLTRTTPEDGATAYLERVDPRSGPRTLVKYSGKAQERNDRGRAIRGKWFLEADIEGYAFPEFVQA